MSAPTLTPSGPVAGPAPEPETGAVRVAGDVELRYDRRGGPGPDVVLVPNFFMDRGGWWPFSGRLLGPARVLAYDLRDMGDSTHPEQPPTWDDHVHDLAALLDGLGVERPVLVGTSFSALLVRDYAIAHPQRVAGLVFAGPAISPWGVLRQRRIIKSWLRTLDAQGLGALYEQMYPLVAGDRNAEAAGNAGLVARRQGFLSRHTEAEVRGSLTASLQADPDPDLLGRVACPTLVVAGDEDFCLAPSGVHEVARLLPEGRAVLVPQSGHLPFIDAPDVFQGAVLDFLADLFPAGG